MPESIRMILQFFCLSSLCRKAECELKKTFLTLFAILIYSLRELRSEYVLCVFEMERQRKHKTGDKCGSDVLEQFL